MSVGEYATKFEELARFCPYTELEVDGRSKCFKFESGLRPKLKRMMFEDNLKANKVATPKSISPRDYGTQRNHMQGRGKERVEDDRKPYAAPIGHRDRNFQRSRPPTVPTGGVSTPMCNKCGRLHYGSKCPGSGNDVSTARSWGTLKDRRLNVIHAERARDHGRVATPSGVGTSGVDDPVKANTLVLCASACNVGNAKVDMMNTGESLVPLQFRSLSCLSCSRLGSSYSDLEEIVHELALGYQNLLVCALSGRLSNLNGLDDRYQPWESRLRERIVAWAREAHKLGEKRGEGDFVSKNSLKSSRSLRRETRIEIVLETLKICESLKYTCFPSSVNLRLL
ncbi:hypothetical protein Lal_00039296 [Lupinus albus]|nr:hypothetical protein Lal_00039296 [Lupinus albus]